MGWVKGPQAEEMHLPWVEGPQTEEMHLGWVGDLELRKCVQDGCRHLRTSYNSRVVAR